MIDNKDGVRNIEDFFSSLKANKNINISMSLYPYIKERIELAEDEDSLNSKFIVMSSHRIEEGKRILDNIPVTNDIYKFFRSICNNIDLDNSVYHFQFRSTIISKTIKEKIDMLKDIEEIIIEERPENFYQTIGESIYRIKYRNTINKSITIKRKRKFKDQSFSKLSSSKSKKDANILKRELKKNKTLSEKTELVNKSSDLIDKDNNEDIKNKYIERTTSIELRKRSNEILKIIEGNRSKIKYRAKTEKEIATWVEEKRKKALIFFKDIDPEEFIV